MEIKSAKDPAFTDFFTIQKKGQKGGIPYAFFQGLSK